MFLKGLSQNRFIELVQIKNPDLAFQLRDIFDDLVGLRFPDTKVVAFPAIRL